MARKSRKDTLYQVSEATQKAEKYGYRAGLYGRISVETFEKIERDTIGTQMALLRDFAAVIPDLVVYDEYIDDDVTGTSFSRPEYERMMDDVESGKINCIIVKDLSRFARDHIGAGEYLEKIFPEKGIRFIAITDNIDTLKDDGGVIVPFKNIINERYAKESSIKLTQNFKTMQSEGLFCSSKPPYGYKRSDDDKHMFVVDEEAANVVKQIFEWYVSGVTKHKICRDLEEAGVMCPAKYAIYKGYSSKSEENIDNLYWNPEQIAKIVSMQQYCGDMVQNKAISTFLETGKKGSYRATDKSEWIIVENTHEAIVSREVFAQAQVIAARNVKKHHEKLKMNRTIKNPEYCLSGILKCAHCGANINVKRRVKNGVAEYWYVCPKHDGFGNARCEKSNLPFEETNQLIFTIIKRYMHSFLDTEELLEQMNNSNEAALQVRELNKQKSGISASLYRVREMKSNLYVDMREGLISEMDYAYLSKKYSEEQSMYERLLADIEKKLELFTVKKDTDASVTIRKFMKSKKLSKTMVDAFVSSIVVDNEGQFDVSLKIKDEYDELMKQLILREGDLVNAG